MTSSGFVLVDKPQGWTSHDVVAKLRGLLRERRIGHAGTLDPMATGLLVVAVGHATRLLRFATDEMKVYEGEVTFGVATDSLDAQGQVTATGPVDHLEPDRVREAARFFVGASEQIPPMVSAIKIDGQRLHQLARQGKVVDRPARPIEIASFAIEPTSDPSRYRFVVTCSPGTYVRVLAADLAERLGTVGHLSALRRRSSGSHSVDDAYSLADIEQRRAAGEPVLRPALGLVSHLPTIDVDSDTLNAIRQGKRVVLGADNELVAVVHDGELSAILKRRGESYQPDVVLAVQD